MVDGVTRFDTDTAVTRIGDGLYEARIDPGWWIVNGPNGGYVAAILVRAAADALGDPERAPVTATVHYTSPPREGSVRIEVAIERVGRSVASTTARMTQDDRLLALCTVAFSKPRTSSLEFADLVAPDVPPPDGCNRLPPSGQAMIPLNDRYESRWAFGDMPFSGAPHSESGGWIRTEDARGVDHLLAVALADAGIPPVFSRLREPGTLAVPTVELTVYLRGGLPRPAGEFVLGAFRTRTAAHGYLEEDGELWSEDGVLLAQCRQLAAVVEVIG